MARCPATTQGCLSPHPAASSEPAPSVASPPRSQPPDACWRISEAPASAGTPPRGLPLPPRGAPAGRTALRPGRLPQTVGRRCPQGERAAGSEQREGGPNSGSGVSPPMPLLASQLCRPAWGLRQSWGGPRGCLVVSGNCSTRKGRKDLANPYTGGLLVSCS